MRRVVFRLCRLPGQPFTATRTQSFPVAIEHQESGRRRKRFAGAGKDAEQPAMTGGGRETQDRNRDRDANPPT
jgi:hypothetical protein